MFKGGTYTEGTITFGEAESGKNGHTITYKSAAGETAIISGGTRLDGWTLHDDAENIYVADIPEGTELIRQFYVNGQPMPNAYTEISPTDWTLLSSGGYMSPNVDSADSNEYLILDLGEDKLISSVVLYSGTEVDANGKAAGFPKDFTISTSADGEAWTVQVTETDFAAPAVNGRVDFVFSTTQARYIKIDVTELGAPDRLNRAKYNLALTEVIVGFCETAKPINLGLVQHIDFEKNLLTETDTVIKAGYYENDVLVGNYGIGGALHTGRLIDGNPASAASPEGLTAEQLEGKTLAFLFELGKVVSVSAVELTVDATYARPVDFEIQISTNGAGWTTVVKKQDFEWSNVTELFDFNPAPAKYIRVLGHETTTYNDGKYYMFLNEAAVYKPADVAAGSIVDAPNNDNCGVPQTWGKDYLADGEFKGLYTSAAATNATGVNAPVTLDMGETHSIAGVRLYPRYNGASPLQYIVSARFSVSEDGRNFETVMVLMDIAKPTSGAQLFVFPEAVDARYVRVEPLEIDMGPGETGYRFQLYEIEVAPAAENPPEYVPAPEEGPEYETEVVFTKMDLTTEDVLFFGSMDGTGTTVRNGAERSSNPYSYLVDGDPTTYTMATEGLWVSWGLTYAAALDVTENGEPTTVGQVEVQVTSDYRGAPATFHIQVADAAGNWTTVKSVQNYDWSESQSATFTFDPVEAYQLRLWATSWYPYGPGDYTNTSATAYLMISEMTVGKLIKKENSDKLNLTAEDVLFFGSMDGAGTTVRNGNERAEHPYAHLVDGDPATYAMATELLLASWGLTYAAELDVTENGEPTTIGQVEVQVTSDHRCAPATFHIQVADAAGNWTTVKSVQNYDWSESQSAIFAFAPVQAYQLRLWVTGWYPLGEGDYTAVNATGCLMIVEMAVYKATQSILVEDPSNPIPDSVVTQGASATYGSSYDIKGIEAKNDNSDNEFKANKAIDSYTTPTSNQGWLVPESWNLDEFGNVADMEIHFLNLWYHSFVYADGVSSDGTEVIANTGGRRPTWLANAYEFIDCVGEWYIDRTAGKIYYKAAGTMDGVEAILPTVEQVIDMKDASNIVFDGITFEHTSYTLPSEIGYADTQANAQVNNGWTQVNGGIMMDSCENITITNSVIRNMGTVGIKVRSTDSVSDNVQITNNRIYDISYSGIIIGEVYKHNGYESWQLVTDTVIRNNYITRIGLDMYDSPAITATYTNGTIIDHNEIAYCPYTGISTGWGWDEDNDLAAAEVGNLQITNNLIHDVMKTNRDGGAIYNLGSSAGTKISGNYMYNSYDGDQNFEMGIYMDQGSANIEIYNNVVGGNAKNWFAEFATTVHDNHCHDNFYHADLSQVTQGTNTVVENNTAVEDGNFDAYPEAMEIINNAGLLDETLKSGVDNGFAPEHRIVQEMYPAINSRYIRNDWGWSNVQIEGQVSKTILSSIDYTVSIVMPAGTDLSALALTFELYDGWTCNIASGSVQDFTNPVDYTLTNGELTVTWSVIVTVKVEAGGQIEGTHVTLDEAIENYDSEEWTKAPSASTEDSLTFNTYSGYIGERFGTDTILHFDMTSDLTMNGKDWLQISLRNQNPYAMIDTEYNIGFNWDNIEVQKFVDGERTVLYGIIAGYHSVFGSISNDYYTPNVRHSITVGAINVDEGVRLFLYVDGNLVFDIIDSDNPITDDGYFAVYGMTHAITLSKFTDIKKLGTDVTLDDAIENYDAEDWTKAPSASTEDSLTFNTYSGYIGERFDTDTILHFDMTSDLYDGSKDWLQISLRNNDPYTMCISGNTEYNIGFNYDNVEVQKFVKGERTVLYGIIDGYESIFGSIPNDYYTKNVRHSITVGAINVDEGVRLFLYVDGNLVFDIIDADDPITDDGFFAVYGMTHAITLSTFTDIQRIGDTAALEEAIAAAEAVDAEAYTEESYAALTEALEAAKAVLTSADGYTQEDLDAAAEALNAALEALVESVDTTALEEAIAEAEAVNADDYTPSTYAALTEALEAAKAVLADAEATQDEVDAAVEALNAALEALVALADTTALEEAIADAEAVEAEKYTEESYAALTEALEAAEAVLADAEATQEEVDAAAEALNAAVEALEEVTVPDPENGKTGDDSMIVAVTLLMVLSVAAICAIITLNKRMNAR